MPKEIKVTDILREYAEAISENWGYIDGRNVNKHLQKLADLIDEKETLSELEILELRDYLGICLSGKEHWQDYCNSSCMSREEFEEIKLANLSE